jgi:hypothetical protein
MSRRTAMAGSGAMHCPIYGVWPAFRLHRQH